MNVERSASVDAEHPWLGLTSFTEETRTYFHGREEECAELARRVQRKLLTVLFGQSGLGKTSILQAGLVPRLRPEGFCPVYVRLDYHPDAPAPAEQIKRAVFEETLAAGTWTQTGASVTGESLWEFLHHRDDVLKDANGRTLTPILIFDQFEEIFTLGQTDDAGRARAKAFLADLADLVENRPPAALEARIDRDEVDAAKFDFARADYRILISLREDYLANLEALKNDMPSVTQNRMRLARMTGVQAIEAVRGPAPNLVTEGVAAAIVRFVSGGAELAHAEVEPSLLSLICRELNNTRIARGQAEISADLLAGSRDTILNEFYERSLADQPKAVRRFIEDELLTESGFRESLAEERAQKACTDAGAPGALATLVDRRLLRIEERLDVRRVELTHDVLCGVVKASRETRQEREAKERIQRDLAATREKEAATRRAMWRARIAGAAAGVLCLFAGASAIFGYRNMRRAQAAQTAAQAQELHSRKLAYAADMNVALQALHGNNLGRAQELLNRQRPASGQQDLRGWEWRYLWRQTRSDALSTLCEKSEIESIATSADGRWVAIGVVHKDGLFVWDLQTRQEVAHLAPGTGILLAAFSPTEPLLAFTSIDVAAENGNPKLHLWNTATRTMVAEYPLDNWGAGLAFSSDGRTLVTSTQAYPTIGHITLWRVKDGTQLASYPSDQWLMPPATGFAANSDLSVAAYAMGQKRVRVVDLRTGAELWTAEASKAFVTALAFSPDGKTLATAAGFGESDIRLWDVATGKETGRLEGHSSWVGSLVFWPDGKKLASASADQTIRIWDLPSRTCTDVLRGHRLEVWRVALLPDHRTLISGSKDGAVCLWDTSVTHPRREHLTLPVPVDAWHFSSDGRSVLAVDSTGEVARWSGADLGTKKVVLESRIDRTRRDQFEGYPEYHFSRDGHFLALGTPEGTITVWDATSGALLRSFKHGDKRILPFAFLEEGRRLVFYAGADDRVFEWDLDSNREIQSWHFTGSWRSPRISPDERRLVSTSVEGEVSMRNLAEQTSTVLPEAVLEGTTATFSPSGRLLVVTSQLGFARVFDTASWHEVVTLRGYLNSVGSAAFSPDGARLATSASAQEEALKIWSVDSWQEVLTLPAQGDVFGYAAFSPDGNAVGILSGLGQLHIWTAPSWEEINRAEEESARQPAAHAAP